MNTNYLHKLRVDGKDFFTSARDRGDGTPITPVEVLNTTMVASDPFIGTASMIKTFSKKMSGFVIINDGTNQLDFTINGQTFIVKSGESFEEIFEVFTEVDINASSGFRAYCKRLINGASISVPPNQAETINAPSNLVVTGGNAYAYLDWADNVQSIFSSYNIYQSSDGGLNYVQVASGLTSSSYNVMSLTNGVTYYFAVSSVDNNGNESAKSSAISVTPTSGVDTTSPIDVTNLIANNITSSSFDLSWTTSASGDVVSYDVYQGITLLGNVTGTSYNVSGLAASTSYTFKVVAKDSTGNESLGVIIDVTSADIPVVTGNIGDNANIVYDVGDGYLVVPFDAMKFGAPIAGSAFDTGDSYGSISRFHIDSSPMIKQAYTSDVVIISELPWNNYDGYSNPAVPNSSYTIGNTGSPIGAIIIWVSCDDSPTTTEAIPFLQGLIDTVKVEKSANLKVLNIPVNVSSFSTRAATAGFEYVNCIMNADFSIYNEPVIAAELHLASNGFSILSHSEYSWTGLYSNIKITSSENRLEMLLPQGTLNTLDAVGVEEYISAQGLKVFYG